jgi:hypothetical protein
MKSDPKYKWKYVASTNSKAARKAIMFKSMARRGCAQSDWVSGSIWSSPIAPLAPPVGGYHVRS